MENSSFGRLIGVLVSPVKTFRSIAERPTWGVAMVVFVLCLSAMSVFMFQKVDFGEMMREQMAAQGRELPADAQGMEGFMKGCTIVTIVGAPVLFILVLAAIYLVFNLMGGQLRYPASLSVVLHAAMPGVVAALLTIPVILSRESLTVREMQGRVLKSNLAFLAPEDAGPRLVALLASFDFFTLWSLVLSIIGFHIVAKVSKTTAAVVAIGLWILTVLLGVALAGLRGPQGG